MAAEVVISFLDRLKLYQLMRGHSMRMIREMERWFERKVMTKEHLLSIKNANAPRELIGVIDLV